MPFFFFFFFIGFGGIIHAIPTSVCGRWRLIKIYALSIAMRSSGNLFLVEFTQFLTVIVRVKNNFFSNFIRLFILYFSIKSDIANQKCALQRHSGEERLITMENKKCKCSWDDNDWYVVQIKTILCLRIFCSFYFIFFVFLFTVSIIVECSWKQSNKI